MTTCSLPAASHQFQHPWASSAGGEASKQAKNDDDSPGADEDVRGVGGVVSDQRDVRPEHQLPPYSYCQQDGSCYLKGGGGEMDETDKEQTRTEDFYLVSHQNNRDFWNVSRR